MGERKTRDEKKKERREEGKKSGENEVAMRIANVLTRRVV